MIRKIIISCIASTSLILFSTQAYALINISVGVPLSHTFTGKDTSGNDLESDEKDRGGVGDSNNN